MDSSKIDSVKVDSVKVEPVKAESFDLKKEVIFRGVKIFDIGFITAIYYSLGLLCAKLIDNTLGKFDPEEEKKKSKIRIYSEVLLYVWFNGVVIYIIKNMVELIPVPWNGITVNGSVYEHKKVKELSSAAVFIMAFLYYNSHFQGKIKFLYNSFNIL